jgi:hypothetical protein
VLRLGVAGVMGPLVLSGCRLRVGSPSSPKSAAPAPQLSTDERALGAAFGQADRLATLYAQATVARPDLADALRLLGSDHTAHLRALGPLAGPATSRSRATATATATGGAGPSRLTGATALSLLAQAERSASTATLADLATVSGQAARLLASIAACGSAHVSVLATLPTTPPKAAK